jgi:phosphoglucosamine mutase
MARLFGTDGIRGVAGKDLTAEFAFRLGEAVGQLYREREWENRLLIGRDSRLSGPMLEAAITAGAMSMGCDVHVLGIAPTPVVAFLTKDFNFPLGCVISASHNPIEDNGIKFFDNRGMKVEDEVEDRLEALLEPGAFKREGITGDTVGNRIEVGTSVDQYVRFLADISQDRIAGLSAVVDAACGAASAVAPAVFRLLGVNVTPLNCIPDGLRINVQCGATNITACRDLVLKTKADFGIALDGDADRAILIDEEGQLVDGDQILAMWGIHLLGQDKLAKNSIVGTVLSNKGLEVALENAGGKLLRAPVGDKHVLREMLSSGATIGGEQSGHLIFLDYHTTGDGILTAIMVAMLMRETNSRLSELAGVMKRFPQVQLNISVPDKESVLNDSTVRAQIEALAKEMDGLKGRLLVRPSGTESVIRVMTEAPDESEARRLAEQAIDLFRSFSETGQVTEL